ncbi:ABC transporter substrate-binding protein [Nitrogeniibacter mangrovi]|uniref:ABC transporter substrate-binding protein n=1 Tax=Nitrogeniibacter mangrovi TaxID=2016596 RepID=A0A6C1BBT1_9RHOO|nr:ABC transporter substrate-binding protein [Nitrogeniibacter mangrovi]QID19860.1 ABC transporter substrate-binding protein [Nitrogeniibacter mangrovi]
MASAASAVEPIRIGVTGPFTGGSAPMGLSMRNGIRLAAMEINAGGGLLGRPIQLIERDDEARNERGAQVVQELIEKDHIVAGLGIVNTGVALASQQHYERARIPIITSVATGSIVTKQFLPPRYAENYVFRMSANDNIQAAMIVEEAVDRRGFRNIAIFHDATNYGQLGKLDLIHWLAVHGMGAKVVERFNLRDVDMTPQLRRARAAGVDVILTYGIGPELAHIANAMSAIGWRVPLIGSWTLGMSSFIEQAGPNAEGARMPQTFIEQGASSRQRAFTERYRRAFGTEYIPVPPAAAQGYDSVLVLAAAIRQAGNTDGDKIREALENLHERIEGVVMTYDKPFSRNDHEAIDDTSIPFMGEVKNGRVVFAYPQDRARAADR